MDSHRKKHLLRGVLAGIGGGLAATWVTNVLIEGSGGRLRKSLQAEKELAAQAAQTDKEARHEAMEDVTMKTAGHLSWEKKKTAGPIVHYGFGALMGGLYGGVAEFSATARRGFGTAFAAALFAGEDLMAVPALHLSAPGAEQQPPALTTPFAAHLVYGATAELVRRSLRAIL
jgi:putative membrane protein